MATEQAKQFESTWEQYVASWKEPDEAKKRKLWAGCLADQCVYTDPQTQRSGWAELLDYMLEFHAQSPGSYFATTSFIAHHGQSLATWEMRGPDEQVRLEGMSHGRYDQEGKLVAMTGFFESSAA